MTDPQLLGWIARLSCPEQQVLLAMLRDPVSRLPCGHHGLFLDQPRAMFLSLDCSTCRVCTFLTKGDS